MSFIVFDSGDKEYFNWMSAHPDGFVMNTEKTAGTKYFIIHKSNCYTISLRKKWPEGSYTTKQWIKVCSTDIKDIFQYCQKKKSKFNGSFTYCGTCKPTPFTTDFIDKTEFSDLESNYQEGKTMRILVNSYERNGLARKKCIDIYGLSCKCCGMNFETIYGDIGKGFIHVHHRVPLSTIRKGYIVDPENHLVPVCPNCHAMIHCKNPPLTIDELKTIMDTQKNKRGSIGI